MPLMLRVFVPLLQSSAIFIHTSVLPPPLPSPSSFSHFLSVVEAEKQSRRHASLILTARLAYR